MRRDSDDALAAFYDGCRTIEPRSVRPSSASMVWWAMLGPAAVLLMLAVVSGLPLPSAPTNPSAWFNGAQIQAFEVRHPNTSEAEARWRSALDDGRSAGWVCELSPTVRREDLDCASEVLRCDG